MIDVSDIRAPKTIGEYNYHPPFPEPSHTFMPVPFEIEGRRIDASHVSPEGCSLFIFWLRRGIVIWRGPDTPYGSD